MPGKVVHISGTPLAGAPGRLTRAINAHTSWDAISFCDKDYKGSMSKILLNDTIDLAQGTNEDGMDLLQDALANADIIHLHNQVSEQTEDLIRRLPKTPSVIYHIHSPLREGPLYVSRQKQLDGLVAKVLVVAQMHARFYVDATPVPNIVPRAQPRFDRDPEDEDIKIIYSPTAKRRGRWNGKYCEELDEALTFAEQLPGVKLVKLRKPQPSYVLEHIRAGCDITIDEISTGGFHQVSIEGLQAGNLVINAADEISLRTMMGWTTEEPPFFHSTPRSIKDDLWQIANNRDMLEDYKARSRKFAKRCLDPKRLVKMYVEIYEGL